MNTKELIEDFAETIEGLGYEVGVGEDSLTFRVGGFPVVATVSEDSRLVINCRVMNADKITNDEFFVEALDLNSVLSPYALALLTPEKDGVEGDPLLVLTDTLPIGDLSKQEIGESVESLRNALVSSEGAIKTAVDCNS